MNKESILREIYEITDHEMVKDILNDLIKSRLKGNYVGVKTLKLWLQDTQDRAALGSIKEMATYSAIRGIGKAVTTHKNIILGHPLTFPCKEKEIEK